MYLPLTVCCYNWREKWRPQYVLYLGCSYILGRTTPVQNRLAAGTQGPREGEAGSRSARPPRRSMRRCLHQRVGVSTHRCIWLSARVRISRGNSVPSPDCFVPALPIFMAVMPGKCEVVGICFAKQWFFILLQKEDQLWKAWLNHSFHFLMGFGWIEENMHFAFIDSIFRSR